MKICVGVCQHDRTNPNKNFLIKCCKEKWNIHFMPKRLLCKSQRFKDNYKDFVLPSHNLKTDFQLYIWGSCTNLSNVTQTRATQLYFIHKAEQIIDICITYFMKQHGHWLHRYENQSTKFIFTSIILFFIRINNNFPVLQLVITRSMVQSFNGPLLKYETKRVQL